VKSIYVIRLSILMLILVIITFIFSCEHDCQTCRKFDDKTNQQTDELTACDDAMIQNLESKGYYCR
jgi:hypothetical protein